jgi:hypothetical protein
MRRVGRSTTGFPPPLAMVGGDPSAVHLMPTGALQWVREALRSTLVLPLSPAALSPARFWPPAPSPAAVSMASGPQTSAAPPPLFARGPLVRPRHPTALAGPVGFGLFRVFSFIFS